MKYYLYPFFLLFSLHISLKSQTVIKGDSIKTDEVWNDTVKITDNITIIDGITVEIQPGATIIFQNHYSINIFGKITAIGDTNNRITFTAKDTVLTNATGGWHGLRFNETSTANDSSSFEYCDFLYGNAYGTNWLDQQGGIIAIKDFGKVVVRNNKFIKSKANGKNGIVYIRNGNPLIIGNLIANNDGTGIEISDSADPVILNNTIVNNTGYGINRNSFTPVIRNCIIISNESGNLKENTNQGNYISYCDIPGSGFTNNGNLDLDPKFVNTESLDYSLKPTSPCVDAGSPNNLYTDYKFDIIGNDRIYNGNEDTIIDIGAYELNEEPAHLFGIISDTLFFEDILVGETQNQYFTIINNDIYSVTISSVLSNDDDVEVSFSNSLTLNTGDSIDFEVVYAPKTVKEYNTLIKVESNYRKSSMDSIVIIGKGLPSPTFEISNTKIDTSVDCIDSLLTSFLIQNSGDGALEYHIPTDFFDDFEEGLNNWEYSSNWDTVLISADKGYALSESPSGNYESNTSTTITLKEQMQIFNSSNCMLSYILKTEMENCCDSFITEIKINNLNWIQLDAVNGTSDWENNTFDLSMYVSSGDSLKIRFRFVSDASNNFDGILIDNIKITGTGTENLNIYPTTNSIQPGESEEINILFDANNIDEDYYSGQFVVYSNDPLNISDTITCLFNLNRFSILTLPNDSVLFNNIDVLTVDTLPIILKNTGCDTMVISNAFSDNSAFNIGFDTLIKVPPHDSTLLNITFTAFDSLLYTGNIGVVKEDISNDTGYIYVEGKGNPYAILELSNTLIDTSLFCDAELTSIINISNIGSDTLNYFIPINFYESFEEGSDKWEVNGLWGIEIDTVTGSNVLSDSPLNNYNNNSNASVSLKNPFCIFDTTNSFLSYNIKYNIEQCCDSLVTKIKINQEDWITIDRVAGLSDWNEKKLNLAEYTKPGDSLKVRFTFTSDGAINNNGVSIDEIKITGSGNEIVQLSQYEGTLPPDSNENLTVNFEAINACDETVKTKFRILSNSPFKNIDTIYCNYSINYYSTLTLITDSVMFGGINVLQTDTLPIMFSNTGCDTLSITNISSNNDVFTFNNDQNLKFAPQASEIINIIFTPIDSIFYNGVIKIVNSGIDGDTTLLTVTGQGNPYAVLGGNKQIVDTLMLCGESIQTALTIFNIGGKSLEYSIPYNFYDGFENGMENWIYNNNWGIETDSVSETNVLTESVSGNYGYNLNTTIVLKTPLIITDAENSTLSYQLKYDIESCCDSLIIELQINSKDWFKIDEINGTSDWTNKSYNLTSYIENGDSLQVRFRFTSDYSESFDGAMIDDVKITGIGNELLEVAPSVGTIEPGDSGEIMVTFNASDLESNKYQTWFQINTNNPLNTKDTVFCDFYIKKMFSLNLIDDSIIFKSTDVHQKDTALCNFFNKGCDSLAILDVFSSTSIFTIDSNYNKIIAPNDTCLLSILFSPQDSIHYEGYIGIVHPGESLDTSFVYVTGHGDPYPIYNISRTRIDTTQVCGSSIQFDIVISNTGNDLLSYYIPVNFYDGFEYGLNNWEYNQEWAIVDGSHDGSHAITESPSGDYPSNIESYIALKKAILITNNSNCILSYKLYHEMEDCCDSLFTELKINNGAWLSLDKVNNVIDWCTKSYNLSSYVSQGDSIKIRFRFISDLLNNYDGVMIDDVKITGAGSNQIQLSKNRSEILAGEKDTIILTNYIPLNTTPSVEGLFQIKTNDPFNETDTISYHIENFCEGLDLFLGGGRSGANSFIVDSTIYIGLGENNDTDYNDLWNFNKNSNKWEYLTDFPGESRSNATAFVINDKVYIGLGFNKYTKASYDDFYCFNPQDQSWEQIADYEGGARSGAVAFVIEDKGYVGTGIRYNSDTADTQFIDFWAYNPDLNRWDSVAEPQTIGRSNAQGFSIYGKGYLLGGINNNSGFTSDINEYDPESDEWFIKMQTDTVNLALNQATAFAKGNKGFIAYGNNSCIVSYHPQSNKVTNMGDILNFNNTRIEPVSFILNDTAYFGLGMQLGKGTDSLSAYYPHNIIKVPIEFDHSPRNIDLSNNIVEERDTGINFVGILSTIDQTVTDSFTYKIIEGQEYFYTANDSLKSININYEEQKNVLVKIKSIDKNDNYFEKEFNIQVVDINEQPTNIILSSDSVWSYWTINACVGVFSTIDEDTLDIHTYEIDTINGILDSKFYTISENSLLVNDLIPNTDSIHNFYVRSIDQGGLSYVSEIILRIMHNEKIIESIQVYKNFESDFIVSPNPAKSFLNIKSLNPDLTIDELILIDMSGEIIKRQKTNSINYFVMETSNVKSGIYLLLINTCEGSYIEKIIIE